MVYPICLLHKVLSVRFECLIWQAIGITTCSSWCCGVSRAYQYSPSSDNVFYEAVETRTGFISASSLFHMTTVWCLIANNSGMSWKVTSYRSLARRASSPGRDQYKDPAYSPKSLLPLFIFTSHIRLFEPLSSLQNSIPPPFSQILPTVQPTLWHSKHPRIISNILCKPWVVAPNSRSTIML